MRAYGSFWWKVAQHATTTTRGLIVPSTRDLVRSVILGLVAVVLVWQARALLISKNIEIGDTMLNENVASILALILVTVGACLMVWLGSLLLYSPFCLWRDLHNRLAPEGGYNMIPDATVPEAITWVTRDYDEWGWTAGEGSADQLAALNVNLQRFHQYASDGLLRTWGKRIQQGVYEPIEPAFWRENMIDLLDLVGGGDPAPKSRTTGRRPGWHDVRVSREQIQRMWRQWVETRNI